MGLLAAYSNSSRIFQARLSSRGQKPDHEVIVQVKTKHRNHLQGKKRSHMQRFIKRSSPSKGLTRRKSSAESTGKAKMTFANHPVSSTISQRCLTTLASRQWRH